MSTRKLILTALVCGLAIMLAGGIKLFQVARDDSEIRVLGLGTRAQVADMTVTVTELRQTADATFVTVSMAGVEGADAIEGWRLLSGGKVLTPLRGDDPPPELTMCTVTHSGSSPACLLVFPASSGSATVAYLRGGAQSQWAKGSTP